jgi:hypothetical protein
MLSADGALQRSDDGGVSWGVVTGIVKGARSLVVTGPDALLVATTAGLLRSTDGGATFSPAGGPRVALRAFDSDGSVLYAYGPRALLASRDGGTSWRSLRRPRGSLLSVDFVTPKLGFAVRSGGLVYRTKDGGRSWRLLLGVGRDDVAQVSFGDARHGFLRLAVSSGIGGVLRTSDGGRTWHPQVLSENPLRALTALGPAGGAALGQANGHLFSTTTGGDAGVRSALRIRVVGKKRARHSTVVTVAGRLRGARAGAGVSVTARIGGDWVRKFAKVSARGRFRTTWRLRRSTVLVAQYRGGAGMTGAGTPALAVKVRRAR